MSYRFSPSTCGFYLPGIHKVIPEDAVSVSAARHTELMLAQAQGARIVASPTTGRPSIQRPPDTVALRRAALERQIKREAARRIEAVSPAWRQLNDMRAPGPDGLARFTVIDAIRAASDLVEEQLAETAAGNLGAFPVADNPLWPSIEERT